MNRWLVKRDGEILATCGSEEATWRFIHETTPFFTDWAIKYEGYEIIEPEPKEGDILSPDFVHDLS